MTPLYLWLVCGAVGMAMDLYAVATTKGENAEELRSYVRSELGFFLCAAILATGLGPFLVAYNLAVMFPKKKAP